MAAESESWGGNIPAELAVFVGRRDLLAQARDRLTNPDVRLLTLTGSGGIGKTRTAMRLAADLSRRYPDGVWWVDLAELTDPHLIADTVRAALPLHDQSHRPAVEVLADALAQRHALIILDNCDHVGEQVSLAVTRLLSGCRRLQMLATSREPLDVVGEQLLDVPSLSLPARDRPIPTESEAMQLFEIRAQAVRPDFAITATNVGAVADVVALVDGNPLAVEMAAHLTRELSILDIVGQLRRNRLTTLTEGPSVPARHRTLWETFDVSYRRCSQQERLAWARLSVLSCSFTAPAATAVVADDEVDNGPATGANVLIRPDQVPALLRGLVRKSILRADTDSSGSTRYLMRPTTREYGLAQLGSGHVSATDEPSHVTGDRGRASERHDAVISVEEAAARTRHARFFHDRAATYARYRYSADEMRYLREAGQDLNNYRALLDHYVDSPHPEDAELCASVATNLAILGVWFFAGSLTEGLRALRRADEALARTRGPAGLRTVVLSQAIWMALCLGDQPTAQQLAEQCHRVRPTAATTTASPNGEIGLAAVVEYVDALCAWLIHADPESIDLLTTDLDDILDATVPGLAAVRRMYAAIAAAFLGSPRQAMTSTERYLAETRASDATLSITWAQYARGVAEFRHGDMRLARSTLRAALHTQWDLGDRWGPWCCVEALAWTAAADGQFVDAATLLGAAESLQRRLGVAISGLAPWAQAHAECVARVRASLSDDDYVAAQNAGAAMNSDGVVAFAMDEQPPTVDHGRHADRTAMLTAKQQQVARLLTEKGMSDADIAKMMFISRRTVQSHVSNILARLGLQKRTEIARWWTEQQW